MLYDDDRMIYSCTHMAAVGVKGLTDILLLFFSVSNLDAADLNKPRVEVEFNASPNNTSE